MVTVTGWGVNLKYNLRYTPNSQKLVVFLHGSLPTLKASLQWQSHVFFTQGPRDPHARGSRQSVPTTLYWDLKNNSRSKTWIWANVLPKPEFLEAFLVDFVTELPFGVTNRRFGPYMSLISIDCSFILNRGQQSDLIVRIPTVFHYQAQLVSGFHQPIFC